ncbi:hypothetical protein STFE110948_03215 [Streptobacillus felis]|uniref:hypothetical protein n=1 Tax=Streptobacillus felis TaxID=1384509 RepID=UPI00083205DC|nr:hypothetical protein [Streptobacillus felis]
MKNNLAFLIGIIVSVTIVFLLTYRKRKRLECKFDERQKQNLNLGYKYGFNGMLVFMMLFALVTEVYKKVNNSEMISLTMFVITSILVGITIVAAFTIFTDSYLQFGANLKKIYFTNISIGLLNLFLGISLKSYVNILVSLLMFIIAGGVFIRNKFHKEDEE